MADVGAILVDHFGSSWSFLLARPLSAYNFDYNSLKLINSSLCGKTFRTKIGSSDRPYLNSLERIP